MLPAILAVNKPYESDPATTELGHTTATERDLYRVIALEAAAIAEYLKRPLRLLDVCAASGGAAWHVLQRAPCSRLLLLDIDTEMCRKSRERNWPLSDIKIVQDDAVTFFCEGQFDVILANSAYHHIEDARKVAFLRNMARRLTSEGKILVGEHFLPVYRDNDNLTYRAAVERFYEARIQELERRGDDPEAIEVIRQTGRYCWERRYEYQVSRNVFLDNMTEAGLVCERADRLWPSSSEILPKESGTFFLLLTRGTTINKRQEGVDEQ